MSRAPRFFTDNRDYSMLVTLQMLRSYRAEQILTTNVDNMHACAQEGIMTDASEWYHRARRARAVAEARRAVEDALRGETRPRPMLDDVEAEANLAIW